MSDRCREERSQIEWQPVVTDAYDYIVITRKPAPNVPHILQHAASPYHGCCAALCPRRARTHFTSDLVHLDAHYGDRTTGWRDNADRVPAPNKYRGKIQKVGFNTASIPRADGADRWSNYENAAMSQAFLLCRIGHRRFSAFICGYPTASRPRVPCSTIIKWELKRRSRWPSNVWLTFAPKSPK